MNAAGAIANSEPRISVVIPTHNRLTCLQAAIDSVLAQTYPIHELWVVDDGSNDGSSEWVREHHPQIHLISQDNHGVSHARNRAIEQATGDWLAFLDSDDRWFPDKLSSQVGAISAEPAFRLCHCDEHWIRSGKRVNPKHKHKKSGGEIFANCLPLCAISPSAVLIKKSLFDEIGLFDESLPACEDYDLWLRITAREPVLYIDKPLLEKTGGHDDQLSRRYPAMDRYRLQALAKLLRGKTLTAEQTDLALAMFTTKLRIFCNGATKRGRHEAAEELMATYKDIANSVSIL